MGLFASTAAVAAGSNSVYAPCGEVKNDKEERLVIKLRGKRSLRFREAFAVTPVVSCDRPCRGRLSGRKVVRKRSYRLR